MTNTFILVHNPLKSGEDYSDMPDMTRGATSSKGAGVPVVGDAGSPMGTAGS